MIRYMKIAIIGFGREGQSLLAYLKRTPQYHGAELWVLDRNPTLPIPHEVRVIRGIHYLNNLEQFDLVFRSPGTPFMTPELVRARKRGVHFSSPTKLFFEEAKRRGAIIIGVTGTKGKGTTSTLIYHILSAKGGSAFGAKRNNVFLGGNIGTPPLDFAHKLGKDSWVVLELSSFQLIDLEESPSIAVVLMVTSEHLDWHKSVQEYVSAKANIVRFQSPRDSAVIADEYPRSRAFAKLTPAKIFFYSKRKRMKRGAWAEDGRFWFSDGKKREKICAVRDLWIPGFHNLDNTCAAITVAKLAGINNDVIKTAIREFRGLEHRLEFVTKVHGAKYYDDSISTVPETGIVALQAFDAPKILILGGSSKGSNFKNLGKVISQSKNIKAIIGVGVEWPRIKRFIKNPDIRIIEGCKNMKTIVRAAKKIAAPGDVVLLSPGCASYDWFQNYIERGEQFTLLARSSSDHR